MHGRRHETPGSNGYLAAGIFAVCLLAAGSALAVDVVPNGSFDADLSNWTVGLTSTQGTRSWDGTLGGGAPGSLRWLTTTGRRQRLEGTETTSSLTATIDAADQVYLSFYWYKTAAVLAAADADLVARAVLPSGGEVDLWSELNVPNAGQVLDGNVTALDVSGSFTESGQYELRFYMRVRSGNDNAAWAQINLDDIVLDVVSGSNAAPTVAAGSTGVSLSPVNRFGSETTTISTQFSDADLPGVGAFTVTMKVREPGDATEVVLVDGLTNGNGGLAISDQGGGNYTASYDWDPGPGQALGLYDLYFEVTDGTDVAVDGYADNLDELEVNEVIPNAPPVIAAGAAQSSANPVNRVGTASTTISVAFSDADQPGVGAFTVTLKVREPDEATEVVLVGGLTNGNGGLVVTDQGGGDYTASVSWDPGATQALGLYDIHAEVTDGTDTAIDGYANNPDEFEVIDAPPNNPPLLAAGATQVSLTPVNRFGTETTTISATFSDADVPGAGAFTLTFRVREPGGPEVVLVDALTDGNGGLTVTDQGGGTYTASYAWDPSDVQALGLYDLYCEVTDGEDTATDGYANNPDELEIYENIPNSPPVIASDATTASKSPVGRTLGDVTTISAPFTDADQPGVGAFTVTIKVREPDNVGEQVLVAAQTNGNGGLVVTDQGGGSYTASYVWDPPDATPLGFYDLYMEISDGEDTAVDGFGPNEQELEVVDLPPNNAPVIATGATSVSPSSVARLGAATTTLSVPFTDSDQPGAGGFTVTLKVREPFGGALITVADALTDGVGGLTVTDGGGGSYTAQMAWDPPADAVLGYYSLYALVDDGEAVAEDLPADNPDELLVTSAGENAPPVVPADATYASPAGVERIGANLTTIAATYQDTDVPGIGAFTVTFKIRHPDDTTEIVLAQGAAHGTSGVTISDGGAGIYTASVSWDPPDAQELGLYDLYFQVSDGSAAATDGFANNENELEVYDAVSNQPVTLTAGTTAVQPTSITRLGSDYTMIYAEFTDPDIPGVGAFTVTIKVRDPASAETTIVTAAQHAQQGLRVKSKGGGVYEASVLWDPPTGAVTGTYDLYFQVTDNFASTATDDYADNLEELTVTAAALAGDGNLLRRTHDANACGGPTSACHNIQDHQGQNCLVCHTPHGSSNIYLIREIVQTPGDGPMPVLFKTLGQGDPYNDPDPVAGDPASGAMADDSDGVYTSICEVCHQTTDYHRNDGTQPKWGHNNVQDCRACHSHADGFPRPEGSGESDGGVSCTCHSALFNPMNSSTSSYHHQLQGSGADYAVASKTCLMCHVDHNIFRDDLNPGVGTRAKNLRRNLTSPVVQGDNTVLLNSDYESAGSGGICLSCHVNEQTKGYVQPDGSTKTPAIDKAAFDAATSSHNYSAPSTYTTDGSTFNANCSKCHNDDMAKSYQDNAGNEFGTHDSSFRTMVDEFGASSASDPLEEKHCLECHSSANPNAGSNLDRYGVQPMSTRAVRIGDAIAQTFAHPIEAVSGVHQIFEDGTNLGDGSRHAECVDCHNVHEASQGTHDGSSALVSNALKGAWGVQPTGGVWPAAPTPSDNGNVYVAPAGFEKVQPAQYEWQICLKCHSNYVNLPVGSPNLAEQINPNYTSTHGIASPGTNDYCNSTTMNEPWGSSKVNYCSDCHRSDNPADPNGPHGSNMEHLLVDTVVSSVGTGTPLCLRCHRTGVYFSGRDAGSRYSKHPGVQGSHAVDKGCFACHMWEFSATPGLGLNSDPAGGQIFVHGMNKRFVYNEQDGTVSPTQHMSDSFIDGYLCDVDFVNRDCWAETCKVHSPQNYSR